MRNAPRYTRARATISAVSTCGANRHTEHCTSIEWHRRATRLRPDDPTVLLQLADAEWAAGLHGEAAKHYQYLLERAPKHAERPRILERLAEGGDPAVR